jgi:hypothetical protein
MMATSNCLRVLTFATFMVFALAVNSDFSLNPFTESTFHNGNASLDVSPSALSFAQLVPRQQKCAIPGDCMRPRPLSTKFLQPSY